MSNPLRDKKWRQAPQEDGGAKKKHKKKKKAPPGVYPLLCDPG